MLFAFVARVNQHFSARKRSGIPDQKGVLDMIRGLPDDYLFPGNNKVWHGTVALHFFFFMMVRSQTTTAGMHLFTARSQLYIKGKKTLVYIKK